MKIILIRHGMTKGNLEKQYIGKTDEGLLEEGKQKLSHMKERQYFQRAELVFTSPMKRCRETAELLFGDRDSRVIEKFRECDFGLFEGKNYEQLKDNPYYQKWLQSGGAMDFPEGEGIQAFKDRCVEGFFQMLSECKEMLSANQEGVIACVVHGGTIMSIMEALAVPKKNYFDYQVKNGEGFLCEWKEGALWIEQLVS